MRESLRSEIIHLTCCHCRQITSFSLGSLAEDKNPVCPYCGAAITVDLEAAENDALRKAQELDQAVDSLGSNE